MSTRASSPIDALRASGIVASASYAEGQA